MIVSRGCSSLSLFLSFCVDVVVWGVLVALVDIIVVVLVARNFFRFLFIPSRGGTLRSVDYFLSS